MKREKLLEAIEKSGLKHKHIADGLGISERLLAQKLLGNCKWKIDEVNALRKILKLSTKDVFCIFFN